MIKSTSDKRRETMIRKYGSEEAYLTAVKQWASKGGLSGSNGLAEMTPEQRSEVGKKGHKAMLKKMRENENK